VLVAPVLADASVPADTSAPADVVPVTPVPPGPVLVDPVLVDPSLAPVPAAGGVLSAGLLPVPPAAGGLDVAGAAGEELPTAGGGTVAAGAGLAVLDGGAELLRQGVPVAPAVCLPPVALSLAFAEAGLLAPPVAEVALAVPVAVAVAVSVAVAVTLSPGLLLVLPLGGPPAEFAGDALGATELAGLADLAAGDDGEPDAHAVASSLLGMAEVPP
jgi:hypothetical protein